MNQEPRFLMKNDSTNNIKGLNDYHHPGSYFY